MSRAQLTAALLLGVAGVGAGAGAQLLSGVPAATAPQSPPTRPSQATPVQGRSDSPTSCPPRTLADDGTCIPAARAQRERGISADLQTRKALPAGAEAATAAWHTNALTPFGTATTALSWQLEQDEVQLPALAAAKSLRLIAWGPQPGEGPGASTANGSIRITGQSTWLLFLAQGADMKPNAARSPESQRLVLIWGLSSKTPALQLHDEFSGAGRRTIGTAKHRRLWLAVRRARTGLGSDSKEQPFGTPAQPRRPGAQTGSLAQGRWQHSLPLAMSHWLRSESGTAP